MMKGTVAKDLFLSKGATCTPRREVQSCLSRTREVVCAFAEDRSVIDGRSGMRVVCTLRHCPYR